MSLSLSGGGLGPRMMYHAYTQTDERNVRGTRALPRTHTRGQSQGGSEVAGSGAFRPTGTRLNNTSGR